MASPGVKAGVVSGFIYSVLLSGFSIWTIISVGPEGLRSIIMQVVQLPEEMILLLYTLTLIITAPIIILYVSFLGLLFGLLYNWALERAGRDWGPLLSMLVAGIMALVASLTVNLPIPRSGLFAFALVTSPVYGTSLFLLHRRFGLKFDPAWLSGLGDLDKGILLALGKGNLKVSELSSELGISRETATEVLNRLEDGGYVEADYENRYKLTEKGKLCSRALTST